MPSPIRGPDNAFSSRQSVVGGWRLEAGGVEVDEAAGFQAGDDPLVLSALCCGLELSTKITWLVLE